MIILFETDYCLLEADESFVQRNGNVELLIAHPSVKGGRKALDNGMETAAPRMVRGEPSCQSCYQC